MASRIKGDERGDERCANSSQDRTDSPPSTSSHLLDGGGREPGMLGEWEAVGFDIDGNPAIRS